MTSTTRLVAASLFAALLLPGVARAQAQDSSFDGGTATKGVAEGTGIPWGRFLFNLHAGTAFGWVSNVFYEEDGQADGAAFFDLLAGINASPIDGGENETGEAVRLTFLGSGGFNIRYREYLNNDRDIRGQRGLGIAGGLRLDLWPDYEFSAYVSDQVNRSQRSFNLETSDNIFRFINTFRAGVQWKPVSRTVSADAGYQNTVDVFESDRIANYADRMQHLFFLQANYNYLPATQFYVRASQGIFGSLGQNELAGQKYKFKSYPTRLRIGANSAITPLTTLRTYAGWSWGNYESGSSFSGVEAGLEGAWRYSPLGVVQLGVRRRYRDSINANYHRDWQFILTANQQINRFMLQGSAQYINRRYRGIPDVITELTDVRVDHIFQTGLGLNWYAWRRVAFNARYDFQLLSTDFRGSLISDGVRGDDDPSFIRHQFFLGAHASY